MASLASIRVELVLGLGLGLGLVCELAAGGCRAQHREPAAEVAEREPNPSGHVRGVVTSVSGRPIANARVCAWRNAPSHKTIREELFASVCTETDDSGAYVLALRPGVWIVVASLREHLAGGEHVVLRATRLEAALDLTLAAGGRSHTGVLVNLDGAPVPNAQVDAYTYVNDRQRWIGASTTTDPRGRFELWARDDADLSVTAPGLADTMIPRTDSPNTYVVLPGSFIAGRVVDDTGEPVAGARVAYLEFDSGYGSPLEAVRTDAAGNFRLLPRKPGRHEIRALADEGASASQGIEVGFGQTVDGIVLVLAKPLAWVRGRVVERGGEPVANCRIKIDDIGDPRSTATWSWTDEEGSFAAPVGAWATSQVLAVDCSGMVGTVPDKPIEPDGAREVVQDLEVVRGRTLRGRLLDAGGQPVVGAHVFARVPVDPMREWDAHVAPARGFLPSKLSAETDGGGQFEIEGLAPGAYDLTISGWAGRSLPVTISEDAPTTTVELALPAGASLSELGKPLDELGGEPSGELDESDFFAVRVLTPAGAPVPNAVVGVQGSCFGGWALMLDWTGVSDDGLAITNAEGRAKVKRDRRPPACRIVAARPGQFGRSPVTPEFTGEVVIEISETAGSALPEPR